MRSQASTHLTTAIPATEVYNVLLCPQLSSVAVRQSTAALAAQDNKFLGQQVASQPTVGTLTAATKMHHTSNIAFAIYGKSARDTCKMRNVQNCCYVGAWVRQILKLDHLLWAQHARQGLTLVMNAIVHADNCV